MNEEHSVLVEMAYQGLFPLHKTILNKRGEPYLKRYVIYENYGEGSLAGKYGFTVATAPCIGEGKTTFLHHILQADDDPYLHTHPWEFTSQVIHGGYVEEVAYLEESEEFSDDMDEVSLTYPEHFTYRAGHSFKSILTRAHRILRVLPDTWTLVKIGHRATSWGFLVDQPIPNTYKYVNYKEHLNVGK